MQRTFFLLAFALPLLLRGGWETSALAAILMAAAAAVLQEDKADLLQRLRSPWRLALYAVSLFLVLSLFWTDAPLLLALSLALVPLYLALWSALAEGQSKSLLLLMLVGAALFEAAVGAGGVLLEMRPFADQIGGSWRAAGTLGYPLALAGLLLAALPFSLRGFFAQKGRGKAGWALACALIVFALLLTGERLAIFSLSLLALSAMLWPEAFSAKRKSLLFALAAALPLFVLSSLLLRPSFNQQAYSGVLHGREEGWREALQLIGEKPWGWGAGSWDLVSGQKSLFLHSFPLEASFAGGVIAGLASLLFLFFWLRENRTSWHFLLAPLVAASLLFLFDWAWLLPALGASFMLSTILAAKEKNTYNLDDV